MWDFHADKCDRWSVNFFAFYGREIIDNMHLMKDGEVSAMLCPFDCLTVSIRMRSRSARECAISTDLVGRVPSMLIAMITDKGSRFVGSRQGHCRALVLQPSAGRNGPYRLGCSIQVASD